ncbi:Pnap_2097 family protein [uncultured Roseibium sp.]|uniref:Pnap_2097 family protein n=1 Tax=uncultured Roseibium sp. TaxID=1936171 RepID=UPI00262578B3|nr:Pnap_2097 family protein [uncultured Roseibium sp.]
MKSSAEIAATAQVRSQGGWQSIQTLGMPELGYAGLSENWMLKTLGHRHWRLIANAAGQQHASFKDRSGNDVYAAFCALSVDCPGLFLADLDDSLETESTLYRVSRARLASLHALKLKGEPIASVCLVSTFVSRMVVGENASVARVDFAGLPALPALPADLEFPHLAARLARSGADRHLGLRMSQAEDNDPDLIYETSPSLDFNRAGLVYFPSFVAAAERAASNRFGKMAHQYVLRRRDVLFFGNLDLNEPVAVRIADWVDTGQKVKTSLLLTGVNERRVCEVFCEYGKIN